MKKTIFVFINGYLPGTGYGGPVTSIWNFTEWFGDEYDIRIVSNNHDHNKTDVYQNITAGWNKVGKANVMYMPESEYGYERFLNLLKDYDVAMVYLSGMYVFKMLYPAVKASKKLGLNVVLATMGMLCKNVLAMKSYKKIPYLYVVRLFGIFQGIHFQVTSEEEYSQLQKYLGVKSEDITLLPNIHGKAMNLKRPDKEPGKAKMLFISRIHPKKNLLDAIRAMEKIKGDLEFDIYGSIEDTDYWEECQKAIQKVPSNVKIKYCGQLDMMAARASYYGYHAFVFPTLSENYGHVIVESLIANCPMIITKGTTPWDDVDGVAGYVVELHDIDALSEAIDRVVALDANSYNEIQRKLVVYRERKLNENELLIEYEKLIKRK